MLSVDISFLNSNTFLFAVIFGAVPSFVWGIILFWKSRRYRVSFDRRAISFVVGVLLVVLTLLLQRIVLSSISTQIQSLVLVLVEELFKVGAIILLVFLWSKNTQRPIEYVVYAVYIALGFSMLENSLYFLNSIQLQQYDVLITAGIRRFEGPTLMHILTLSLPISLIGTQFFKSRRKQFYYGVIGFGFATVIHFLFNIFINQMFFPTVIGLWVCGIALLYIVSLVKKLSTEEYLKKREQDVFYGIEQVLNDLLADFTGTEAAILKDSVSDHGKLVEFLTRLRYEYMQYLIRIGDDSSQAHKVAESVVSENMSIRSCKIILATLRK